MASRALVAAARSADDYLAALRRPDPPGAASQVILHWLGDMFDPQLAGYWGSERSGRWRPATVLALIREHAARIDGIKISLLEEAARGRAAPAPAGGREDVHRRRLQLCRLIEGDGEHHSHALLGIFDPIAPAAARGACRPWPPATATGFRAVLEPTVPLSRKIFEAPTQYYKAGVVLLAWLNGHQSHFAMVGGMQSARSALHYAEVFRLADKAGLLRDPELAATRMTGLMALHGVA